MNDLPQSLDAEVSVLGSVLLDSESFSKVISILEPKDFYVAKHQKIFNAMLSLFGKSIKIDLITISDELNKSIDEYFLTELSCKVSSAANIEQHAYIVKEKSMLRKAITIGQELSIKATDSTADPFEIVEEAENKLMEVVGILRTKEPQSISLAIHPLMDKLSEIRSGKRKTFGIPTGFYKMDETLGGLIESNLITIAARPSIGKSALMLSMAYKISATIPVGIFSIEMSREELLLRMMSMESGISSETIKTGKCSDFQFTDLSKAVSAIYEKKIFIDDSASLSLLDVKAKTKRLIAENGVKVIFIDFLQKMATTKEENRNLAIGKLTGGLKALSKEFNIPVVILSQLNREVESRGSKRPELSDLRDSGEIEQDSDVVIFIHRPEKYNKTTFENGESCLGLAEIIIDKHRNGRTGYFNLQFNQRRTRFYDLDEKHEEVQQSRIF
jgi:replicative DNA helicase